MHSLAKPLGSSRQMRQRKKNTTKPRQLTPQKVKSPEGINVASAWPTIASMSRKCRSTPAWLLPEMSSFLLVPRGWTCCNQRVAGRLTDVKKKKENLAATSDRANVLFSHCLTKLNLFSFMVCFLYCQENKCKFAVEAVGKDATGFILLPLWT